MDSNTNTPQQAAERPALRSGDLFGFSPEVAEILGRFNGIHKRMAKAAKIETARVRCEKCGREQTVDGGDCLARGWPKCHGYTMTLLR